MKKSILMSILLLIFLGVQNSYAEVRSWNFDKVHSNFYFDVKHVFSTVRGHFREFSGTIKFDPQNLAGSSFVFEIDVDSINTDNGKRDKHLLSADFFDEKKFPTIRFDSKTITAAGDNVYNVVGKFTIKGKSYDLSLPLTLAGIKQHPSNKDNQVVGFNGKLTIDRLAYNVGTGKLFKYGVVDKDVDIFVSLEALGK